jgi:phospholipase C
MSTLEHVFLLMLENRSFDHMLGLSGITGTDVVTGAPTTINGLTGTESNSYNGTAYTVNQPAPQQMPVDPGHEFVDTLTQLAGAGATYPSGGPYPPINNSGFVADYASSPSSHEGNAPGNYGEIMACFTPSQLPVLTSLAKEFVVCDNWFASMPGPTWPNRFFLNGSSSGGLDDSPTTDEILEWDTIHGFRLPNGTIFDALNDHGHEWTIYHDGFFVMAAALHGIFIWDLHWYSGFASDIANPNYAPAFTLIEPNYGDMLRNTYENGTSQHPLDDVSSGEAFIKSTYEALRNSPLWEKSMLIITWDEHGGFYDHVAPPAAVPPGDNANPKYNTHGFTFDRLGVRVPAVIVSPLVGRNLIDHRVYDHTTVNATLERLLGIPPLTARDQAANDLLPLLATAPRIDAPQTLPQPIAKAAPREDRRVADDNAPITGNLAGFLHIALRYDLAMSPSESRGATIARVRAIKTRGEAADYINEVQAKAATFSGKPAL